MSKSNVVYVIRDLNSKRSRFKIGKHTGTMSALISRYQTYIPELKVELFLETEYAHNVELEAKKHFKDRMIALNGTKKKSEWCEASLKEIVEYIKGVNNRLCGVTEVVQTSSCIIL
jgi:hypothetical protein